MKFFGSFKLCLFLNYIKQTAKSNLPIYYQKICVNKSFPRKPTIRSMGFLKAKTKYPWLQLFSSLVTKLVKKAFVNFKSLDLA